MERLGAALNRLREKRIHGGRAAGSGGTLRPWLGLMLAAALAPSQLMAQNAPTSERDTINAIGLDTVRVGGRIDDLIGIATSASQGRVGAVDLQTRPIARAGELLETVPGLIVTQHSGEGKANQYFVRGFNLDHGTDFLTRVEGMPVNLPTHGHGQGYTDLNFIIPEFVDLLDYRLGVYHAELGDFSSAGGAEFHLARSLPSPLAGVEIGADGYRRVVGGASMGVGAGELLLGGEAKGYDGPWDVEQDVEKFNGIARYTWGPEDSRISILGLAYRNQWNASDQIPRRAVRSGLIDRFGQINPTDGGNSQRYSLSGSWRRIGQGSGQEVQAFAVYSDLDLFSDFTYFLDDPVAGDQFHQKDRRVVLGLNAKHLQDLSIAGVQHSLTIGLQNRVDVISGLALDRTHERSRTATIRDDEVVESGTGLFVEASSQWSRWFRTVLGLRADGFTFDVDSDRPANSGSRTAGILSPKASLVFAPTTDLELYLSGGLGFHSNDARGTTISVDPLTGESARKVDPLVRSRGAEVGLRFTPGPGFRTALTGWVLSLDSELLFVGDAGATEPSDRSVRSGITWTNFYRPTESLTLDADVSLSRARLENVPENENRIPGALERVFTGGITWAPRTGLTGAIRVRHFGDYPLIEDNSVRADATTLVNGEIGYQLAAGFSLRASIFNIFDAEDADIQYYYASRLAGEPAGGVEDIHFHPVEPRQLRISITWNGASVR